MLDAATAALAGGDSRRLPPRSSSGRSASRTRRASTCARSSAGSSRTRSASSGSRRRSRELAERHTVRARRRRSTSTSRPASASATAPSRGSTRSSATRSTRRCGAGRRPRSRSRSHRRAAVSSSGSPTTAERSGARRFLAALAERAAELNGDLRERDDACGNGDPDQAAALRGPALARQFLGACHPGLRQAGVVKDASPQGDPDAHAREDLSPSVRGGCWSRGGASRAPAAVARRGASTSGCPLRVGDGLVDAPRSRARFRRPVRSWSVVAFCVACG